MAGEILLDRTLSAVERSFGIGKSDILKKNRNASVSRARAAAYKILVSVLGASVNEAGTIFGRSRLTVAFGLKAHERWMASDHHYPELYREAMLIASQPEYERIRWIPVQRQKPPELVTVLLSVATFGVSVGCFYGGEWRHLSSKLIVREVTHWAGLPKGPTA